MPARETIRIPTRDVIRILALIFGFYIAVRLLWIAHPVIFLFFLGVLFGLPISQERIGWRNAASRAGSAWR